MQYVIGALLALLGFFAGAVFSMVRLRRKTMKIGEDPSNPIFQAMFNQIANKAVMPALDAMAGMAERHDAESRCVNGCGHRIAALIRAAAMGIFSNPFPAQAPKEALK